MTDAPVALVTGGARGIGESLCTQLAADGHRVAVNYRSDAAAAQELVARIEAAGTEACAVAGDVRDPRQAEHLVHESAERFGAPVEVLVNNVGEFTLGPIDATSPARWAEVVDSNLNSAFYVTQAALPAMRVAGRGCIVMIGLSPAVLVRGAPNMAAYAVAKTGIAVLTRSMAAEEARHGVRVNCVAPGLIDNGHLPPQQAEWMARRVPAGRLGSAQDVADAVSFLVSKRAGYVSGTTLTVSGGWDWEDRPTDHDTIVSDLFRDDALVPEGVGS